MVNITTSGGMITFTDTVSGLTKQIGQNRLWIMFRADTVNFLQVDIPTDGYDGTPFWSVRASNLTINGETYTIEELKQGEGLSDLFTGSSFGYLIVDELPDEGEPNIIYLVLDDETGTYIEYLWLSQEEAWEEIGSVGDVELTNYYTKSEVDTLLGGYAETSDLATVATTGSYTDLSNTPVIPTVPTNVSAFTNDAGYLTEHQSLDNYYNKTQTDNLLAGKQHTLTAGANITIENNVISATGSGEPADLTNYYTKTETNTLLNAKADNSSLATVATSGNYNDLTNKPTIPTVPTNVSSFVNDAGYLTQHQSLADVFGIVDYDSTTKHINFYGKDDTSKTTVLGYVDATSFVADGMIEDVRIADVVIEGETVTCLVIDFNTESGIQDIYIPLTDIFDPSNYYTKTEVDNALATKANSSSLSTVATSGSYNDLTNKPTIPAAQVNSDWNASSGVAQILNKPTLATVATSGSYNDLSDKPVIPAGVTVDQTLDTSSTNAIANSAVATALNSKADSSALSDYATTSAMNTALAGKQDTLTAGTGITITNNVISATGGGSQITVDSALSSTSTNPVQNAVIYAAIGDIEAALQAINGTTNS